MTPRSCLRWKLTGKVLKNVVLRWVPTGKQLNSCTGKVESEPTHGSNVDIPHIHACKQTLDLSAGTSFNGQKQQRIDLNADALYNVKQENLRVWLLKMLISQKPVPECSGLVLHQMTSDHNRSELGIQDHSNEQTSSKLVPKVVPLAVKTATSRQELELLFHLHIAMLRTTEHPSDTNVFTMKMEILLEQHQHALGKPRRASQSVRKAISWRGVYTNAAIVVFPARPSFYCWLTSINEENRKMLGSSTVAKKIVSALEKIHITPKILIYFPIF
ncbi:hypothetical protein Tco_1049504 [Tanacetum coccineum]